MQGWGDGGKQWQATPAPLRGRAFGVAVSGLYGVQGLGALAKSARSFGGVGRWLG